jgi:hypothetical protein
VPTRQTPTRQTPDSDPEEPVPIVDRRARLLLALSAVAIGLAVLDLALFDGVAATIADAGLGQRAALLAIGTMALPGLLVLGRRISHAVPRWIRSVVVTLAPPMRLAPPANRLLLRQQARHHTGTILALRL